MRSCRQNKVLQLNHSKWIANNDQLNSLTTCECTFSMEDDPFYCLLHRLLSRSETGRSDRDTSEHINFPRLSRSKQQRQLLKWCELNRSHPCLQLVNSTSLTLLPWSSSAKAAEVQATDLGADKHYCVDLHHAPFRKIHGRPVTSTQPSLGCSQVKARGK
jgi:hypothetical protein